MWCWTGSFNKNYNAVDWIRFCLLPVIVWAFCWSRSSVDSTSKSVQLIASTLFASYFPSAPLAQNVPNQIHVCEKKNNQIYRFASFHVLKRRKKLRRKKMIIKCDEDEVAEQIAMVVKTSNLIMYITWSNPHEIHPLCIYWEWNCRCFLRGKKILKVWNHT